MADLKLSIDLLPRGAWGNDLSKTLSKKDWDTLRNFTYAKANHVCAICGYKEDRLDAHEVWDFDVKSKTQTLKDIIALCTACHGVKHMRNSERLGYGESARSHFLKINQCSQMVYAKHYAEAQFLFEERNKIMRWKVSADLSKFGGKGIEIKEKQIPYITNPYESVEWSNVEYEIVKKKPLSPETGYREMCIVELRSGCDQVCLPKGQAATYIIAKKAMMDKTSTCPLPPKICDIEVNNYEGKITVTSDYTNKIQWILDNIPIKVKYNIAGRFITQLSVENLQGSSIRFRLIGDGGEVYSKAFGLRKYSP